MLMKKTKLFFCIVLTVALIVQITVPVFASDSSHIQFGMFPQDAVQDEALLTALNGIAAEWRESDGMRFADAAYNGKMYRAVMFAKNRGKRTDGSGISYQKRNGYVPNTVYWFAYAPIVWRVLDAGEGICMSELLLDAQPFDRNNDPQHGYDYAYSTLRTWLNADFYETAFTSEEQAALREHESLLYSFPRSKPLVTASVTDQVFLLSRRDVINEDYGFNHWISVADHARRARGTDYAKCQGLKVYALPFSGYKGNSLWWMCAPGYAADMVNKVYFDGYCSADSYRDVNYTHIGVRPCICLDLSSLPDDAYTAYENPIPNTSVIAAWIWKGIMAFVRLFGPIQAWFV